MAKGCERLWSSSRSHSNSRCEEFHFRTSRERQYLSVVDLMNHFLLWGQWQIWSDGVREVGWYCVILGNEHLPEMTHQDNRRKDLINWISPATPWKFHTSTLKLHQPGTGNWLQKSAEYTDWASDCYQVCWLNGPREWCSIVWRYWSRHWHHNSLKAGSGKTLLLWVPCVPPK